MLESRYGPRRSVGALLARRIPRHVRRARESFIEGHGVRLHRDGREAYPAMFKAIEQARSHVLLEMYWFSSDRVGRRFAEALAAAARREVEVAVLYDSVGSWDADGEMFAELAAAGVRVIEFSPVLPYHRRFRLDRLARRNHRKLLVVDGKVGFVGGINLAEQWLPEEEEGGNWRDDMVEVRGPAVVRMVDCFRVDWTRQGGESLRALGPLGTAAAGTQNVRVIAQAYHRRRREILRAYLLNIYTARRRVWLTNAYFVPDPAVVRALVRAARRGVDVRVLLPGVTDVTLVRYASRAMWARLIRRGVRIYEYGRSVLHAKSAVIDGSWSTVGSYNLDFLSRLRNLEVNVAVRDEQFGAVMQQSFLSDLELSREVRLAEFERRPFGERILEALAYRIRRWL